MPSTKVLKSQPSTLPRRSLAIRQIVLWSSARSVSLLLFMSNSPPSYFDLFALRVSLSLPLRSCCFVRPFSYSFGWWHLKFPVLLKNADEALLPVIQHHRCPGTLRPDFLRQDEGRRRAFALEVHVLLGGEVVVAGGRVLANVQR